MILWAVIFFLCSPFPFKCECVWCVCVWVRAHATLSVCGYVYVCALCMDVRLFYVHVHEVRYGI